MCKALGWVGVGVKPTRACLCLWSQRGPLCCSAPPQGLCNAPHDSGMCWKQFMMCLEDTWFVAAFYSTPMHNPGLSEVQRPARVCVCKGASVLPCLLSCCCWRRTFTDDQFPQECLARFTIPAHYSCDDFKEILKGFTEHYPPPPLAQE